METLLQDLRYGVRTLLKSPVYTVVTIIVLALGIGANTAIFSVVNGVLLRPLPYKYPDRIVSVLAVDHGKPSNSHSPANYTDLKNQNQSFEYLSAYRDYPVGLVGAGEPRSLTGPIVSSEFFDLLGIEPAIGRTFHSEDGKSSGPRLAVLSHKLWQSAFNEDKNIVGRQVTVKNEPFTITGVMPPGFAFPEEIEIWLLAQKQVPEPPFSVEQYETQRSLNYFQVMGRLKPGVSVESAQADLGTIAARLQHDFPDANDQKGLIVRPLQSYLVKDVRASLLVLLGAVAAVLLIAVANVANLSLARSATRQQEMAIRVALGASRFRIVRQLLTESLLLSCLGGAGGLLLSLWGTSVLISLSPEDIPRLKDVTVDARVFVFTVVVSILAGVLFGLSPSIQSSKPNLNEDLKEGSRGSTATGRRFRSSLVIAEVALSMVLLISAGLMIKSFARLQEVNMGFNPANVLVAQIGLPEKKYSKDEQMIDFVERLIPKIKSLPGVVNVGTSTTTPYSNSDIDFSFQIEGRPVNPNEKLDARFDAVSPDFFTTFQTPLIKGRFFTDRDSANAPEVSIINQTMAKRFFAGEDPIGKKLITGLGRGAREIVGVVGDVRYDALNEEPLPQIYNPVAQSPLPFICVVVRTS